MQLSGDRATALALVFSELLQNALEHGGSLVNVELRRRDGDVVLCDQRRRCRESQAIRRRGTGLSIVSALVKDELGGTLALDSNGAGLRAVVTFPA